MYGQWSPQGMVTGIGSLPHASAVAAARFSLSCGDVPAVPTLPRRSPSEGIISQAVSGMRGVSVGQYGSISVDVDALDRDGQVDVDLHDEAYGSLRAFLAEARRIDYTGPVKWQFVGPVTLGIALVRAGVPATWAFDVAVRSVRAHVRWLLDTIEAALPVSSQMVFIDEPSFGEVGEDDFHLAPDAAIDLVSTALALVERRAVAGLHCCAAADVAALLATGPQVLSVPVARCLEDQAARLIRFLEDGGVICWGAVPTSGPLPISVERPWRDLTELWATLVRRGADPMMLRHRALLSPQCGLGTHTPQAAEQVFALTRQVGGRVRDQGMAQSVAPGA